MSDEHNLSDEVELLVGRGAISAYSRLSYTIWYALAEFIDNSTQARENYADIMKDVLEGEGQPLLVEINYNKINKTITIKDNSIGMTKDDLVNALKIATPTVDSKGRSKYGMGMKTAAFWIGAHWTVRTTEWANEEEWTAEIDVARIVEDGAKVPLTVQKVDAGSHYTEIVISKLHRRIQTRAEENIQAYLGSMYRSDLKDGSLKILYGPNEIVAPDELEYDTDSEGVPYCRELPEKIINGKTIRATVGVLRPRKGGRKWGGFSLFRNKRMIVGFPNAWKPRSVFGGVDNEGGNNLVSQRLTGIIELDEGFDVSHTKDAVLWSDNEEAEVETWLEAETRDLKTYAGTRRGGAGRGGWSREKIRDLVQDMKAEFTSDEMRDSLQNAMLPPHDIIVQNVDKRVAGVTDDDEIAKFVIFDNLRIKVSLTDKSEYEPYVVISVLADGTVHVIINGIHPYYTSLDSDDQMSECIRQYLYDAVAEYKLNKLHTRLTPQVMTRMKDDLLKVRAIRIQNAAQAIQNDDVIELHSDRGRDDE